ncbi:MAG TPA: zinc ribbon domain-containing protein, partial [Thermoplasmata archaeon]|nr:zinc ribbon domain-containing protein [Thermoplasmata archaeon]
LFDLGENPPDESPDLHANEGKNIDDILASIMDGKADQPEIFETLKSVAKDHPSTKDLVVEAKPAPAPEVKEDESQFLCPVCDTPVHSDDTVCPGCGAEFSEGQATEYECPVCKAAVPAEADHCPSCGVRFAEEEEAPPPVVESSEVAPAPAAASESPAPPADAAAAKPPEPLRFGFGPKVASLRDDVRSERREMPFGDRKLIARELPRLVNEVKPLLVTAKKIGVRIDDGKRLINGAVEAGKRKEIEKAVRLISDARKSLDVGFIDFIGGQIERFASQVEAAGRSDAASLVGPQLETAFGRLEKREYDAAWAGLQAARVTFQSQAKEYTEGRKILEATERLLAEVRALGMDSKDVDRLIRQSREAGERRDLPASLRLAHQAQERLLQAVPEFVQSEMREARDRLLDVKVRGGDLSKPVGILKEASAHVKNEEWSEAIRYLKEFKKEISRIPAK